MNRLMTKPYLVNRGSDYYNTGNIISGEQEEHIKKEREKTTQTALFLNITQRAWFVLKKMRMLTEEKQSLACAVN